MVILLSNSTTQQIQSYVPPVIVIYEKLSFLVVLQDRGEEPCRNDVGIGAAV